MSGEIMLFKTALMSSGCYACYPMAKAKAAPVHAWVRHVVANWDYRLAA